MNSSRPRRQEIAALVAIVATVWGLAQWAGSRHEDQQAEALRQAARPGDILMLSSTSCGFCKLASVWLIEQRVAHRECFIERDAACLAEYQARGARGTPTFVVRGHTVIGFDRERIRAALARAPV